MGEQISGNSESSATSDKNNGAFSELRFHSTNCNHFVISSSVGCHQETEQLSTIILIFMCAMFSGLQFRYKTRVYKQTNLDEKALAKLSTKVFLFFFVCFLNFVVLCLIAFSNIFPYTQASLKKFLDYIQTGAIDKMGKVLDKGLDPNFHDPDTGGELYLYSLPVIFSNIKSIWGWTFILTFSVGQKPPSLWPCSLACRWRASGSWFRAALTWTSEAETAWRPCTKLLGLTITLGCW